MFGRLRATNNVICVVLPDVRLVEGVRRRHLCCAARSAIGRGRPTTSFVLCCQMFGWLRASDDVICVVLPDLRLVEGVRRRHLCCAARPAILSDTRGVQQRRGGGRWRRRERLRRQCQLLQQRIDVRRRACGCCTTQYAYLRAIVTFIQCPGPHMDSSLSNLIPFRCRA